MHGDPEYAGFSQKCKELEEVEIVKDEVEECPIRHYRPDRVSIKSNRNSPLISSIIEQFRGSR